MNIIETFIYEKKYLSSLHTKRTELITKQNETTKNLKSLEKEINQNKKTKYELNTHIKHYNNVDKIIRFNTIIKFIISLLLTIFVLKFIPNIYASLLQNIILIPLYFGIAYTWVKSVNKELEFKNNFDIVLKKIELDNLTFKIKTLEEKLSNYQIKLNNINKSLNKIKEEEEIHSIYFNKLKDILENYYLNTLTNYLGEDLINSIKYPKLELKKF